MASAINNGSAHNWYLYRQQNVAIASTAIYFIGEDGICAHCRGTSRNTPIRSVSPCGWRRRLPMVGNGIRFESNAHDRVEPLIYVATQCRPAPWQNAPKSKVLHLLKYDSESRLSACRIAGDDVILIAAICVHNMPPSVMASAYLARLHYNDDKSLAAIYLSLPINMQLKYNSSRMHICSITGERNAPAQKPLQSLTAWRRGSSRQSAHA